MFKAQNKNKYLAAIIIISLFVTLLVVGYDKVNKPKGDGMSGKTIRAMSVKIPNVKFKFQDAETLEPLENVEVKAEVEVIGVKLQGRSNKSGEFVTNLHDKSSREVSFVFSREGYFDERFSMPFPIIGSQQVETVKLFPEYMVKVQVKTLEGIPLEGAEVTSTKISTKTDQSGKATLRLRGFSEKEKLSVAKLGWKLARDLSLLEHQERSWSFQGMMVPYREVVFTVHPEDAKEETLSDVDVYELDSENRPIKKLGQTSKDGRLKVILTHLSSSVLFDNKPGYEKKQIFVRADAKDDIYEVMMQRSSKVKVKVKVIAKSAGTDKEIPTKVQIDRKDASPEMEYEVGYHHITVAPELEGYKLWDGTRYFDIPTENIAQIVEITLWSNSYDKGQQLERENQVEAAVEEYRKIVSPEHPDYNAAHSRLGSLYSEEGNYKAAIEEFRKVVNLPRNVGYALDYYNLGYALYYLREYGEAVDAFEKVGKFHQNLPSDRYNEILYYTYCHLALANEKLHEALLKSDVTEAERHLREAGYYWQKFYDHLPSSFEGQEEYQPSLKRAKEHSAKIKAKLNL